MALRITSECVSCDACAAECPNQAILEGSPYVINSGRCTECVGAFRRPQCQDVCPVACIIADAANQESQAELKAKYARLHSRSRAY